MPSAVHSWQVRTIEDKAAVDFALAKLSAEERSMHYDPRYAGCNNGCLHPSSMYAGLHVCTLCAWLGPVPTWLKLQVLLWNVMFVPIAFVGQPEDTGDTFSLHGMKDLGTQQPAAPA